MKPSRFRSTPRQWRAQRVLYGSLLAALAIIWTTSATLAAPTNMSTRMVPIMTQNIDEATDFGPLLTATTLSGLLSAVADAYLEVQASNIPERAAALAREIAKNQPTLIGLQEVSLWRTGPFATPPATTVAFDQLQSLLGALDQQGLHYAPIGIRTGLDAEAPSALGFDVRVTDRDVVLARTDLALSQFQVLNVQLQNFAAQLVVTNPITGPLAIPRGWIAVDAQIRGTAYRFITTHLEGASVAIQIAQGNELLTGPGNTTAPIVFAGDFNSAAAGGPDSNATYGNLIQAGYTDAWAVSLPGNPGFTWPLHGEDPFTPASTPTERIDLVLVRSGVGVLGAQNIGNTSADLTPSGLWPSDHAGVVAMLAMPDLP
jgi:endonuclease/exonuclease/phosphatase family metal-dependent hydrolase